MRRNLTPTVLLVLFCALVLAPGCAAVAERLASLDQTIQAALPVIEDAADNAGKAIANGEKIVASGTEILAELQEAEKQARIKADLDGSGGLNGIKEYLLYGSLLANVGTGVLANRTGKKLKDKELTDRIREGK